MTPESFDQYRESGGVGILVVESGPLVRSSYHAEEQAAKLSPIQRAVEEGMDRLLCREGCKGDDSGASTNIEP